jgi:LmbE family N-acetylglucosaminyl deacetylase
VNVYNGDRGGALEEGPWRNEVDYRARLAAERRQELDLVGAMLRAAEVIHFGVSEDGVPGGNETAELRRILHDFEPEVVLLPWFLDGHLHHKITNYIFANAAKGLDLIVLAYEIWDLLTPNAFFDITDVMNRKLEMIAIHASQVRTMEYGKYAAALAGMRAFHYPVRKDRSGAVEAYLALPAADYCDLVFASFPFSVRQGHKDGVIVDPGVSRGSIDGTSRDTTERKGTLSASSQHF